MSDIRANTISDASGNGPINLTGQSAAKAWVSFNTVSTTAIHESLNVSTISDNSIGETTVNLANSMSSSTYCITACAGRNVSLGFPAAQWIYAPVANKWDHETMQNGGDYSDADYNYSAALGDLA
jgi:hypothetical protein